MEVAPPPDDFFKLCVLARSLCGFDRQPPRGKVEVLPPSAVEFARRVQGTQEFRSLADSLFRKLSDEDYTGKAILAEVLKRSGFYHSSLKHGDAKSLWLRIQPFTKPRKATLRAFLLLGGCRFPFEDFEICGSRIRKLSAVDINHLGPNPEVCESFYPAEAPDHRLSDFWFLTRSGTRDRLPRGFIDVHDTMAFRAESAPAGASISFFPTNDPFDTDDPGGGIDSENDREDVVELYWESLLVIALWSSDLFRIPVILLSERGVQLRRLRNYLPVLDFTEEGEPRNFIDVDQRRWRSFRDFCIVTGRGLLALRERESIRSAARRFLRARFLCRPDMTEDRTEGALLNFIYSLERLLTLEGETEGVTDKIANRTASMVGVDDGERMRVMQFMKSAYGARSGVVHGGRKRKTPAQIDMRMLTDVCRRALAAAILIRPSCGR